MNKFLTIIFTSFLSLATFQNAQAVEPKNIHGIMVYEFEADFEDSFDYLKEAISSRGLVISFISHAKSMLDRTAEAVNITEPAYPGGAEIVFFCKADLSHKLVQANPHYIALCPYAIYIYDTHNTEDKVFLSYRKPPDEIQEYRAIENLLKEIIEEVIEQ